MDESTKKYAKKLLKNSIKELKIKSPAWLIAQFMSYLMRYKDTFKMMTENFRNKNNFNPNCVGVHVRRSDKLIKEAKFYALDKYMEKVKSYYVSLNETLEKCVVLSTDHVGLVNDAVKA